MRTRALEFAAPGMVRLVDADIAEPQEGEVLVRTELSGVSGGTELLAYRGEIDSDVGLDDAIGVLGGTFRFPFRYGYSCVGEVERSRATGVAEGERVFAFHPHQSAFVVRGDDCVVLEGEDPQTATLLPLVETALQASLDAGTVLGATVAVTGLGAVGILTGAILVRAGARVIGSDPLPWRRDAAKSFGIDAVAPEELPSAVGDGLPLVVETSGRPEVLAGSLSLLAHEGVALVVSWYGAKPVPLPLGAAFHRRRLTIRSTQVSSIPAAQRATWTRRSRLLHARTLLAELPLDALATHEFPFEQAPRAYEAIDRGEHGLIHATLRYQ
jgi:2-desacetyl-2-hydroxyethyl bacteriochlorophyllide A dehydrogenase